MSSASILVQYPVAGGPLQPGNFRRASNPFSRSNCRIQNLDKVSHMPCLTLPGKVEISETCSHTPCVAEVSWGDETRVGFVRTHHLVSLRCQDPYQDMQRLGDGSSCTDRAAHMGYDSSSNQCPPALAVNLHCSLLRIPLAYCVLAHHLSCTTSGSSTAATTSVSSSACTCLTWSRSGRGLPAESHREL